MPGALGQAHGRSLKATTFRAWCAAAKGMSRLTSLLNSVSNAKALAVVIRPARA